MRIGEINEAATEAYDALERAGDIPEGTLVASVASGSVHRIAGRVQPSEAEPGADLAGLAGMVKLEDEDGCTMTISPAAPMLVLEDR